MPVSSSYRNLLDRARQKPPRIALVLGSGLGDLALCLMNRVVVPFTEVPGLGQPTVPGHQGLMALGIWAGQPIVVFSGRLHLYEGHSRQKVVGSVHLARELGARILVVTNAAGGIRADLGPGCLMVIRNHFMWGLRDLVISASGRGEFPEKENNQPGPYDSNLRNLIQDSAKDLEIPVASGIYAHVTGPCYETPAEVRALRIMGADAVGMSTACEIQAGHSLGMACAALSCITNRAAGLGSGKIHHEEVITYAARARERLGLLLEGFLKRLPAC